LELLRLRVEALEAQAANPPPAPAPATSPNAFNPRITAFIDLAGALRVAGPDVEPAFDVRSLELDLRADIDPFAKAVAVLAFENPLSHALGLIEEAAEEGGDGAGEEAEAAEEAWLSVVEEAYVDFVALPARLGLELGARRVPFGSLNRSHRHDVPFIDYPETLRALLGEEGWTDAGASLRWRPADRLPFDLRAAVLARGPEALMESRETPTPVLLGRAQLAPSLGHSSRGSLELGGSYGFWKDATAEPRRWHLAGVNLLLQGRSTRPGLRRSAWVEGELLFLDQRDAGPAVRSLGGWLSLGLQPARNVFVAVRGELLATDLAEAVLQGGASAALSLYTSEFLRIRLGYDLALGAGPQPIHRISTQVTAVFGAHPVEPYWVNR
jgi:hypothetical protein